MDGVMVTVAAASIVGLSRPRLARTHLNRELKKNGALYVAKHSACLPRARPSVHSQPRTGMGKIEEAMWWRESTLGAGLYPSTGLEMKIVSYVNT